MMSVARLNTTECKLCGDKIVLIWGQYEETLCDHIPTHLITDDGKRVPGWRPHRCKRKGRGGRCAG